MAKQFPTSIAQRARKRRQGQRMSKEERVKAQETFLRALSNTANIRAACMQAEIDYSLVYYWQEHDEAFSFRFKQANQDANWLIFGEAWQRAMKGEKRYVTSQGKLVSGPDGQPLTYYEKSDRMLELLLKARLPEFRDKQQVEHSGSLDVSGYKDLLLDRLTRLEEAREG